MRTRFTALLNVALVLLLVLRGASHSFARSDTPLSITAQDDGMRIAWQGAPVGVQAIGQSSDWQTITFGGIQIPGRLLALRVGDKEVIVPQIKHVTSTPWAGTVSTQAAPAPQTLEGEQRPDLAQSASHALPDNPIVVFRDGRMRGVRLVVLLISPIFERNGVRQFATALDAFVPHVATFAPQDLSSPSGAPLVATAPAPTNPLATRAAATVQVTQPGLQVVTGATLAAAGIDTSAAARLHLYHDGSEIAIDVRDGGDGRLDATDEVCFFAPPFEDRWNAADRYWLNVEATPGLRMASRTAQPGTAPVHDNAYQSGMWRHNTLYDTTLPGPDGDHWFSANLKTGPTLPSMATNAILQPALPLISGTTTLTVTGSAYTAQQHQLALGHGTVNIFLPHIASAAMSAQPVQAQLLAAQPFQADASPPLAVWSGIGDWSHTFHFDSPIAIVRTTLVSGALPDGVELDGIAWKRPVQLAFAGNGAQFETEAGTWQYRLRNTAPGRTLYDVTNATQPVVVVIPDGATTTFEDTNAAHRYALTGPDATHIPLVIAHTPANLVDPLDADEVYIAPTALQATLAPLVALRTAQGLVARVVDVQTIYDAWSFGRVSPEAIRSFLRYAAATWRRVPQAVTLVGDGTIDPLHYDSTSLYGNNLNLIPPYTAMADPWLGETACDTCYASLDGDDPLADPLPDLAIGRLPVKNAKELEQLIHKLVTYETASSAEAWRGHATFVADNYRQADGSTDDAGDFAAAADTSVALQPAGVTVERVYYDPSPTHVGVPWREPDATRAAQRVRDTLNGGPGLFTYFGHSNQFQLAVTNNPAPGVAGALLSLYDPDALTNGAMLPIVLEMTCLTSAFQTSARSGTTIDERLLLAPNGGAAAVWGSSGLGVSYGHESLQAGFYGALWQSGANPTALPLGQLTTAGYRTLFTEGGCCQESIKTFLLLGDPLTQVRLRRAP